MRLQRHSNWERLTVSTADLVGTGGEARVYIVPPDRRLAAKVYHHPSDIQRRKLQAMLANPPENPTHDQEHIAIAWPIDLVSAAYGDREFVGYLMPTVPNMRAVFEVYNPSVRRHGSFPVDYRYLHRAARNLAAAVRALHGRDHVIGDVNESNILVGHNTLVSLVDTDSFQVATQGGDVAYRCPVGKAEYTPPELQGKRFTEVDRTQENDRFGLAVLIFQLLMEGTHPFAGLYTGSGDPPAYGERIAAGHFPYGSRRAPYTPVPTAPSFMAIDPVLRQLFIRCFEDGHLRPSARPDALTWQNALRQAERALSQCSQNAMHVYGAHLEQCPWCVRRELLGGRDPFPADNASHEPPLRRVFASSLLTSTPSVGSAAPTSNAPSSSGKGTSSSAPPTQPNWQATAPLYASVSGGALGGNLTPTLFNQQLAATGWAWGALFWAILAVASGPLGLPGLNALMTLLAVGCAIMGWRAARRSAQIGRWVSAISAFCACTSVVVHPLTATPIPGSASLYAGAGSVRSLCFSPDGAMLAEGTARVEDASLTDGAVNVWDMVSHQLALTPAKAAGDVVAVSFSPDGRSLVAATDAPFGAGEVVLLNTSVTGAYRSVFKSREHMRQAVWSPAGPLFATAGAEPLVRIWDAKSLTNVMTLPLPGEASAVAFSPDGKCLAIGCSSSQGSVAPGHVTVWDTGSGRCLWSHPAHGNGVQAVTFAPTGTSLATGGRDGAICLWQTATGRLLRRKTAHSYGIAALAFAPDGSSLASAEAQNTDSGSVYEIVLRKPRTGDAFRTLSAGPHAIQALAFSPMGGLLASGSEDGIIHIWHILRR